MYMCPIMYMECLYMCMWRSEDNPVCCSSSVIYLSLFETGSISDLGLTK